MGGEGASAAEFFQVAFAPWAASAGIRLEGARLGDGVVVLRLAGAEGQVEVELRPDHEALRCYRRAGGLALGYRGAPGPAQMAWVDGVVEAAGRLGALPDLSWATPLDIFSIPAPAYLLQDAGRVGVLRMLGASAQIDDLRARAAEVIVVPAAAVGGRHPLFPSSAPALSYVYASERPGDAAQAAACQVLGVAEAGEALADPLRVALEGALPTEGSPAAHLVTAARLLGAPPCCAEAAAAAGAAPLLERWACLSRPGQAPPPAAINPAFHRFFSFLPYVPCGLGCAPSHELAREARAQLARRHPSWVAALEERLAAPTLWLRTGQAYGFPGATLGSAPAEVEGPFSSETLPSRQNAREYSSLDPLIEVGAVRLHTEGDELVIRAAGAPEWRARLGQEALWIGAWAPS